MDGLLNRSGRSWVEVDGHSTKGPDELKDKSVKVDGPKILMSERIKVNGPKMSKWTVQECKRGPRTYMSGSGRSQSAKVDGLNI